MKKLVTSLLGLMIMLSSLQAAEMANTRAGLLIKDGRQSYPDSKVVSKNRNDVITEGFEGTTFPPASWIATDADGDTYNWSEGSGTLAIHTGAKMAYSQSFVNAPGPGAITPNNFLITPAIAIPAGSGGNVNYWVCAQDGAWAAEHYAVCISTTGTAPADFSTILFEETMTAKDGKAAGAWYERNVAIPNTYAGQNVYIAFRHYNCTDMFQMNLDDVVISTTDGTDASAPTAATPTGTTAAPGQPLNISVVVSDATGIASVVGKYQLAGQTTWTDITMTASKVTGTYTGTVPAVATATTGKIKFAMTDTVVPANAGESAEYNIAWALPGLIGEGESFEGTFPPADWAIANIDGAGTTWAQFTATSSIPAHTGTKVALHNFGASGYAEEGLLITPHLAIAADAPEANFKFWDSNKWPNDYLYHGVMVSTTDNMPGSFTELAAIPVATEAPTWGEHTIDLAAYKGQNIYLAFKYTGTFADGWYVDDAKVTGATIIPVEDVNPPVPAAPTGTTADIGTAMTIQTIVTDYTGIASVLGHYQINGGAWADFTMTASKEAIGTYTGTITAQPAAVTGKVKFTCSDTVNPVNTGDSPMFDITWLDPTQGMWAGNADALNTSGLGLQDSAPWKLGVALDFGTANKKITKIAYMCNDGSDGAFNWSVLDMTDATTWSADVLVPGGVLVSTPVIGTEWNVVDVNDTTSLTGTVGLAIDLVAGGFFGRHAEGTNGKSYIYYQDAWLKLGEGVVASFPGDWTLKCWVEPWFNGIGQESEMLPGKSELSQNYPNPFNPSTSINFFNNMTGNVKLTVMNAKGETVATLINNNVVAGNHKVNFDGARFNSGVYFYKLETPTATITKKMLLVK